MAKAIGSAVGDGEVSDGTAVVLSCSLDTCIFEWDWRAGTRLRVVWSHPNLTPLSALHHHALVFNAQVRHCETRAEVDIDFCKKKKSPHTHTVRYVTTWRTMHQPEGIERTRCVRTTTSEHTGVAGGATGGAAGETRARL